MKWIKAENELPNPGKKVITYSFDEGDSYIYIEPYQFCFQDGKGNWINEHTGQIEENKITHWMCLPKAPEK